MPAVDVIGVATDGPGKKVLNFKHAGVGPSGSDVYGQGLHFADPNDPTHAAGVKSALPASNDDGVVTREAPPNVDTGLLGVPDVLTSIVSGDVRGVALFVSSSSDNVEWITVTNNAGTGFYCNQRAVMPRDSWALPLGDVTIAGGVKWRASAASVLQAQFVGKQ